MKVGIVGGGLAGLAAGCALADAGYHVTVFERSRLLGGRATSFEIDGIEVDNGQHVFLHCCNAFTDFVRRAGMGDVLLEQERFEAIVIDRDRTATLRAANLPAPWHLLASFVRFRHLGILGKIDVARALAAASRNGSARNESFADWLARQRQGAEAVRVFWRPFFVPALNVPLEEMDAHEALFTLRTAFLQSADAARFGYSKVPLARIADAAAAQLASVHRSTSIAAVERDGVRATALVTTSGERHPFDAIVVAVTPTQLAHLLGDGTQLGIGPLADFTPHPIVDVHLRYRLPEGGASEARAQGFPFDFAALVDSPVQWVFRKGERYLVCSMSAAREHVRHSTGDIVAFAWSQLQGAIPGLRAATLEKGAVTRNPEATFSAPFGAARPGPRTKLENLFVAGSWTGTGWPDTMESAVRSGRAAAHSIVEFAPKPQRGGTAE